MNKKLREPFVRIARRKTVPLWIAIVARAAAILLALLISLIIVKAVSVTEDASGMSFGTALRYMYEGTFGSSVSILKYFKDAAMLFLFAVALAPVFKMRFWNIGAQGQVLVGALVSAAFLFCLGNKLPNAALLPLMLICSILGGALWAAIPGYFKAFFGTNETLFTLMMNYVAIQLVACFTDIWKGVKSSLGLIERAAGTLPEVFGTTYFWVYLVSAIAIVIMYFYLRKTKQGYEISVVGESINTARYAGINDKKVIIRTVTISGAICGLIGFLYVTCLSPTVSTGTGGGNGFTAIIVAWLANFNTFFMALMSMLLTFLSNGAKEIVNHNTNLNASIGDIIVAVFLFFILGSEFFLRYRLIFSHKKASAKKEVKA